MWCDCVWRGGSLRQWPASEWERALCEFVILCLMIKVARLYQTRGFRAGSTERFIYAVHLGVSTIHEQHLCFWCCICLSLSLSLAHKPTHSLLLLLVYLLLNLSQFILSLLNRQRVNLPVHIWTPSDRWPSVSAQPSNTLMHADIMFQPIFVMGIECKTQME